jgi:hypothetical protein
MTHASTSFIFTGTRETSTRPRAGARGVVVGEAQGSDGNDQFGCDQQLQRVERLVGTASGDRRKSRVRFHSAGDGDRLGGDRCDQRGLGWLGMEM